MSGSPPTCKRGWSRSRSRRPSCANHGSASSPHRMPSGAGSSATSTTARSSTWSRWPSSCDSLQRSLRATPNVLAPRSTASDGRRWTRSRPSVSWRPAFTRRRFGRVGSRRLYERRRRWRPYRPRWLTISPRVIPKSSRRRSTSAARKRFRMGSSMRRHHASQCGSTTAMEPCSSRCRTMAEDSTPGRFAAAPACKTWPTASRQAGER